MSDFITLTNTMKTKHSTYFEPNKKIILSKTPGSIEKSSTEKYGGVVSLTASVRPSCCTYIKKDFPGVS